jgi:hypothetical protein
MRASHEPDTLYTELTHILQDFEGVVAVEQISALRGTAYVGFPQTFRDIVSTTF